MDLLSLVAKLSLDSSEYEKGLGDAASKIGSFGSALKSGLGNIAKVGAAAVGAATSAVIGLATASTSSYAEIEQLRGGVKKLFGEDAAKIVISNANKAFATAGMSAQQYMDQVTSFSAALVNSLGGDTAEAANRADTAMRAISDNINTFGGDIQNVQNAYQGFAKQNYTMLDNLKLGYGGTKTEMERLIEDANKWAEENGKAAGLTIDSFADVVTAIDYIQQKQHIAGTTAAEAASTVSGSLGSVKAAWENLVAGFSDPEADLGQLITNVVDNAEVAFENLMPVFERALEGIGTFIESMGPIIVEKLPGLIDAVLPSAIKAAVSLIDSIAETLPGLVQNLVTILANTIITYGPSLLQSGISLVTNLGNGIIQNVPALISSIFGEIDSAISNSSFGSAWESIKTSVQTAIEGISESFDILVTAFEPITEAVGGVVGKFQEWIDSGDALNEATELFNTGIELIGEGISLFLEGLASVIDYGVQFTEWLMSGSDGADAFMAVLTGIATIIALVTANMAAHAVAAGAYQVAMMAVQGVTNLVAGAQAALNAVMAANPIGIVVVAIAALVAALVYLYNNNETVRAGIDAAWQGIKTAVEVAIEGIKAALYAIGEFIVTTWETVTSAVETAMNTISTVVSTAWNAVGTFITTALTTISSTVTNIWSTILSAISTKMDNIKTKITTVWTTIKTSITNVITLIKSTVTNGFTTMVSNIAAPLTNMKNAISGAFNSIKDTIGGVIGSAVKWGADLIDNFVSGIKNNISKVGDAIGGVADKIRSLIGFSEPEDGPLSRFHTFAPDMMELFARGIDQSAYLVTDALKRNFDFYDDTVKPLNMDGSASSGPTGSRSGDFNETINIYAPTALDPSEVARQTRKANREMMLALRGI